MTPSDPYPVLLLLRAHLEGCLRQGQTRLWLKTEAAEALREIVRMKPGPRPAPVTRGPDPAVKPADPPLPAPAGPEPTGAPQRLVLPSLPEVALTFEEKAARLAEVRARALEGRDAKALGSLRDKMVFAAGSPMAGIVLVGEAPGAEDEQQGEPFAGPAGVLLTKVLKVMGLERSQVYLTHICKYRPAMEHGSAGDRLPSPLEMASCVEFVREELAIVRPKVIVVLGDTAVAGFLGISPAGKEARGKFYDLDGIPVMATLAPSYLLEKEQEGTQVATAEKRKFWEDMLLVMERAGMIVTPKQRAFFLPK